MKGIRIDMSCFSNLFKDLSSSGITGSCSPFAYASAGISPFDDMYNKSTAYGL
jgi:hypothetical protein